MKLFFDLDGFVFVVGLDQKVIEASINWNYRVSNSSDAAAVGPPINGTDYIKKLFQVPFNLPSVSSGQLDDYLKAVFAGAEEGDEGQGELLVCVRPHLDALVGDSEVNPREVKRYINSYILQKLIRPDLDDDVTLVLQTIAFRPDWSEAYEVFRSKPDAFTEAAKNQLNGEDGALKVVDPRLESLPESFFQYISSKGGHKLLTLDSSELEEQVRSFETIRSPESPLAALEGRLRRSAEAIDAVDAVELARSPETFERWRSEIKYIDDELHSQLAKSALGDRKTAPIKERFHEVKEAGDRLAFALRRGDDMGQDDFDKLLTQRSLIVELMRDAAQLLDAILAAQERSNLPSVGLRSGTQRPERT